MKEQLYHRRQFLLTRQPVTELKNWEMLQVNQYCLQVHPDLKVTVTHDSTQHLILLGDMFDPKHFRSNNQEILTRILDETRSFDSLIQALKQYAGRYVLFYQHDMHLVLVQDALALREVYYCQDENKVVCGSQPNLLVRFSDPKITESSSPELSDFMQNHRPKIRNGRLWVGDDTLYNNVKHLVPNHYLDIGLMKVERYWPNRKLQRENLHTAVQQACDFLKGVLRSITTRYDVMIAVTAGYDSRSLLAASREVRDRIYYFINKEPPLNDRSPDIRIPRDIFNKLNIPFHVHNTSGVVDEEFREMFLNNTFMSSDLILPTIYNVYFKNHQDKVNLLGVGEIGREYYGAAPKELDGYYLARCLKYTNSLYAVKQCDRWLQEAIPAAQTYNVDIMKLFLWEVLLGNWGAVGNSESDIAIEEFDPYASHQIYEIMLSADSTQGDLFEGMFKAMWPALLDFPINPPETIKDRTKLFLQQIGIFKHLQLIKYRLDRWKFYKKEGCEGRPSRD